MREPHLYKAETYTNRWLHEILPDRSWGGTSCFIIGGGPSLKNFDWSRLNGRLSVGVNRVYETMNPTILFSLDTRFLHWIELGLYGEDALRKFNRFSGLKVWLCTYVVSLPEDIFIVKVYRNYKAGLSSFTFSMRDGIGHGNNSGYAALNLAACLEANPIYLLGFDMKHDNGKSHWHEGHPMPQREERVETFKARFDAAAPMIKAYGFKVINLYTNNKDDSALECFEKRHVDEVLK